MGLAACAKSTLMTASRTPVLDIARLNREGAALAKRARPGVLGAGLMNLESGQSWTQLGDRTFPMMSVFKAPLAAAALAETEAGRLSLTETVTLTEDQLSAPYSPIADAWPARAAYTYGELLAAAVIDSDNTAADVLMKRIGGPGVVGAWLQAKRLFEIRVDRYEREVQPATHGMAPFRLAWKGPAFAAAVATIPPERRRAAMLAYMADPRDSATPRGMLQFLEMLGGGELLTPASTARLVGLMSTTGRGAERLKAGLPKGAAFAHKPGTSATDLGLTPAYNDVGIFTLPDRRRYAAVAFLTGSTADEKARAGLIADLGRLFVAAVG